MFLSKCKRGGQPENDGEGEGAEKKLSAQRTGKAKVEIRVFDFKKRMTHKEVMAEIRRKGYRTVTLRELLNLAIQHPETRRFSTGSQACLVACVPKGASFNLVPKDSRVFYSPSAGTPWYLYHRFIAARETQPIS